MKLIIAGTGAGDGRNMTFSAFDLAMSADVIVVPRSHEGEPGFAEQIMLKRFPDKRYLRIHFPMKQSDGIINMIVSQLEALRDEWQNVRIAFFPVIGDAMLYSTGEYLLRAWRELVPDMDVDFVPGVSAHSVAASCAKRFLAMREEIFTVIPGTAGVNRIREALSVCDCAAIYKPTVINDLRSIASGFQAVRVDYAGIPELEKVYYGDEAFMNVDNYMSVILLWRA